jgi:hypothetical protein
MRDPPVLCTRAAVASSRMVNISIRYTGDLHCAAIHGPSQSELATDAQSTTTEKEKLFAY